MARAGETLDRYVLVRPIGAGGQGEVWLATDPLHGNVERALKLVPVMASFPSGLERARREARALAQLAHPSLVACHAMFEDLRTGVLGLVLDAVDGQPLTDLAASPALTPGHRVELLRHLASVLAFLHERGVAHRDVKPDNVLVTRRFFEAPADPSGVKLIDLGISVADGNAHPLTREGTILGTTAYMPPEAIDPMVWSTPATGELRDVFALGVLGWELVAGTHPSGLAPDMSLRQLGHLYREVRAGNASWPLGQVADPLGTLLRDCIRLQADRRLRNGADLAARFAQALAGDASRSSAAPTSTVAAAPLYLDPAGPGRTELAPRFAPAIAAPDAPRPARAQDEPRRPIPALDLLMPGLGGLPAVPRIAPTAAGSPTSPVVVRLLLLFVAGLLGFVAIALSTTARGQREPAERPGQGRAAAASPSDARPGSTPAACPPPSQPASRCWSSGCLTGRTCLEGACADPLPDRTWWVRVDSVTQGDEDWSVTHPDAKVCLRLIGTAEQACTVLSAPQPGRPVLRLTTSQLSRLTLVATEGPRLVASWTARPDRPPMQQSLCIGWSVRLDAHGDVWARLLLDDPH